MLLYKKEGLNTIDIEAVTGIPAKTLERYIKTLKDDGVISYKGAGKTGGYYISDKTLKVIKGVSKDRLDNVDTRAIEGATKGTTEGATEGAIEGAIEGVTKGVKNKLAILLNAIAANEGRRVPDYKEVTGLSDSSMERYNWSRN